MSKTNDNNVVIIEDIEDNNVINIDLYKIYFNDLLNGEKYIEKKFTAFINYVEYL